MGLNVNVSLKLYLHRFIFCWDGPKLNVDLVLLFTARPRLGHRCDWVVAVDRRDGEAGLGGLCGDVTWRWLVTKVPGDAHTEGSSSTDLFSRAVVEEHVRVTVFDTSVKEGTEIN
jgi:hypothetical protein